MIITLKPTLPSDMVIICHNLILFSEQIHAIVNVAQDLQYFEIVTQQDNGENKTKDVGTACEPRLLRYEKRVVALFENSKSNNSQIR